MEAVASAPQQGNPLDKIPLQRQFEDSHIDSLNTGAKNGAGGRSREPNVEQSEKSSAKKQK